MVHSGLAPVHASGHAMRDELKLLISIAKPQAFIPVHGEYRHLMHHARLATDLGVPASVGPAGRGRRRRRGQRERHRLCRRGAGRLPVR